MLNERDHKKQWLIDVADIDKIRLKLLELQNVQGMDALTEGWAESLRQLCELKFALDETSIIVVTDVKGVITYVNQKFCDISQYSKEELIGKTHRIVHSGYHSKGFFKQMWNQITSGKVWRQEICNKAKDGSLYWVDTTIVPFLNDQGEPYQFLAIRNETTDKILMRKALEDLLELSIESNGPQSFEDVCKSVQELLGVSYVSINETKNGIGKSLAVWTRKGAHEKIRYELDGSPCGNLLENDHLAIGAGLQKQYPENDFIKEMQVDSYFGVTLKKSSGEVIGNICLMDNKPNYREQLFINIVKLFARRVESELERQQTLNALKESEDQLNVQTLFTQRLSALAAMAAGVAHELNQPLSGIRVYAQMINKFLETPEKLDPELAKVTTEKIIAQVDRASTVIDHMREFSAEKSNRELQLTKVSLHSVVESSLELIGQQLKSNGIQFINDIDKKHKVLANSSRLEQIFINMFSNAKDSIVEKEQRKDEYIKVSSSLTKSGLDLLIEDSGEGIPEAVQNNLFEPFVTSKAPGSGTGLGLSICVGILKDFDSTITLEKTGKKGTVFKLTFPRVN